MHLVKKKILLFLCVGVCARGEVWVPMLLNMEAIDIGFLCHFISLRPEAGGLC